MRSVSAYTHHVSVGRNGYHDCDKCENRDHHREAEPSNQPLSIGRLFLSRISIQEFFSARVDSGPPIRPRVICGPMFFFEVGRVVLTAIIGKGKAAKSVHALL